MNDLKEIIALIDNPTKEDIALIQKAYDFSKEAHKDQFRKNGEPYFIHLFATAKNLAEIKMTAPTIAAGFLHDCMEDVFVTGETIEKEFSKEIRFLVEGVTKLGHIKYRGSDRYNESLRKLFVASSQDIRVLIIKLCDRLHNIQTLEFVPKEKQLRIARETLEIYAPLAYRLGIRKLHRELEDTSFFYVHPKEYELTQKILKTKKGAEEETLEKFLKSIKKELAKNGIIDFHTDYRIKGLYSLYKKLKKYEMDIEKIHDILAVRIIVPKTEDCYKILGIIHSSWRPLPGRIKDYIAFPKPNGYQSLHTTVFTGDGSVIEVQIKTKEMQLEAEYGIASHISYKMQINPKKKTNPNLLWLNKILPVKEKKDIYDKNTGPKKEINFADVPKWVKELVEYQGDPKDEEKMMNDLKDDFFNQRIFVFTPKGDVIDLPIGSSAIDFAFNIHSDIGNHMSGVKINGKLVSLETELHNGDTVFIETKASAKPSKKWLSFAKTTMAKRRILNEVEKNQKKN